MNGTGIGGDVFAPMGVPLGQGFIGLPGGGFGDLNWLRPISAEVGDWVGARTAEVIRTPEGGWAHPSDIWTGGSTMPNGFNIESLIGAGTRLLPDRRSDPWDLGSTGGDPTGDYWGSGPGFDWWDIPDVALRILGGIPEAPWPPPGLPPYAPSGEGDQPEDILRRRYSGAPGLESGPPTTTRPNGRAATVRRGMYIAGTTPGLWHTTPSRVRFDEKTGQPRETGLNRTPNRISLAQDDASGDLQFFAPVEPSGWRFKYKKRARHHHHRKPAAKHHHHPRIAAHGHRRMTAKQMRYFGTPAQRRQHARA